MTTSDGTWTGPNWDPGPPPLDLTNTTIMINHRIDYTTGANINNWNKADGSIIISSSGTLDVNAVNKFVIQSNGFTIVNDGIFNMNLGTGKYKIDKAGFLYNGGVMTVVSDKVEFKDDTYNDTTVAALTQIVNLGVMDFSATKSVHNDGSIDNSGLLSVSDLHNDGYICNTNILQTTGNIKLHENDLGLLGCGGKTFACNIEMEGGQLFDQEICCLIDDLPSQLVIDSSKASYQTGDVDNASVVDVCPILLATGIISFNVTKNENEIDINWIISDVEQGDVFIVQRSIDAITFEDRQVLTATYDAFEGTFYAQDEVLPGIVYYRLKIINVNGDFFYSNIKSITTNATKNTYTIFPIPSREVLSISGVLGKNTLVEIVDINGRIVYDKLIESESMICQINHGLDAGIYSLQIINGQIITSQRIIVE